VELYLTARAMSLAMIWDHAVLLATLPHPQRADHFLHPATQPSHLSWIYTVGRCSALRNYSTYSWRR